MVQAQWRDLDAELETVVFALDEGGPLSWHLSAEEQQKIGNAWSAPPAQEALRRVKCFVLGARPEQTEEAEAYLAEFCGE